MASFREVSEVPLVHDEADGGFSEWNISDVDKGHQPTQPEYCIFA